MRVLGFGEEQAEDGETEGAARSHTMSSEVAHDDDVWASVVENAHCILGTPHCRRPDASRVTGVAQARTAARTPPLERSTAWLVDNRRPGVA